MAEKLKTLDNINENLDDGLHIIDNTIVGIGSRINKQARQ